VDWLIEKNKSGYQMVNSVQRLKRSRVHAHVSGLDLKEYGWNGDGKQRGNGLRPSCSSMPGLSKRRTASSVSRIELPRRPEQRDHSYRWHRWRPASRCMPRLTSGETSIAQSSTSHNLPDEIDLPAPLFLNSDHNLAYCYNDARVIKWLWSNAIKNKFQGGVRSSRIETGK